jgi:hypothetical protein
VSLDDRVDLRVQPTRIAELDGCSPAEVRQQQLEQLRVPLLGRRELQQHRTRPIAEGQHPGAEVARDDVLRKGGGRVGERALGLEAKPEIGRGVTHPLRQRGLLGKTLEGVVDLDRVQPLRVRLEEAAGGQVSGVEDPAPLRVAEAARPDVEGHLS